MKRAHLALIPTLKLWTFELARKGADPATVQRFLSVAIGQLRAYAERGGEILFGTDVGYMTDYDPPTSISTCSARACRFIRSSPP
jgi:hypothetical protein